MPERRQPARQQSPGTAERREDRYLGDYQAYVQGLLSLFGSSDEFRRVMAETEGQPYDPMFLNGPGDGFLPRTVNAAREGTSTGLVRDGTYMHQPESILPASSFAQYGDIELPSSKPKRRKVK